MSKHPAALHSSRNQLPKSGRCVRLAEMRHEKSFDAYRRRGVDDLAQLGMQRNFQMGFFAAFGLALLDAENAIVNMLASNLTTSLRRKPV